MVDTGQDQASGTPHVVVVGGGVAGLAAAFYLRNEPVRVTVLESSSKLGGKLAVSELAGVAVDEGAESTYAYRPKTTGLIKDAGLGDQIALVGTKSPAIWTRGTMRSLPEGQFMGVPSDMDELARSGLLSGDGLARARQDLELPPADRDGDISAARYVAARLGREVVDRLVDPFLAEVFSGRSEDLSFEATLAPLAAASRKHPSLAAAAASLIPPPRPAGEEVPSGIATLVGGLGTLPPALTDAVLASGGAVRTATTVRELTRREGGWRLTVGPAAAPEYIAADAVIVAVPADAACRLLAGTPGTAPAAARLAEIPYASVAIVTLAYPRQAFPGGLAQRGYSGYRVPAVDGRKVKAVTFSSVKWRHLAGDVEIVRCSLGRIGEEDLLQRDDADLAALAAAELAEATGAVGAPLATRVTRWGDALPQYTVGHLDRVAQIRASVATQPGLAVCGAAYDGVGVGTSVASARKAADQVRTWLRRDAAA
jgi:protoporphyrinogen/coproporphyrinogen III oxidase